MAVSSLGSAHREATIGENPINHSLDGQEPQGDEFRGCRYTSLIESVGGSSDVDNGPCYEHGGPSGNYVNLDNGVFLTGNFPISPRAASVSPQSLFPAGFFPFYGSLLCDVEVGGPGTLNHPLDEDDINADSSGQDTSAYNLVNAPFEALFGADYVDFGDGTWDDGGDSAACHGTTYSEPSYNANPNGCGGIAHAEDIVSGDDIWLVATCDWKTTTNPDGGDALNYCVNEIVLQDNISAALSCVQQIRSSILDPDPVVTVEVCGSGGGADGVVYGPGGGDYPGVGVPYPGNFSVTQNPECSPEDDAAQSAFVMGFVEASIHDGMNIQIANGNHPCNVHLTTPLVPCSGTPDPAFAVIPSVAGWIDWDADSISHPWVPGTTPTHVGVGPDRCRDDIDNDFDDTTDEVDADGGCDSGLIGPLQACSDEVDNDHDGVTDDLDCDQVPSASVPCSIGAGFDLFETNPGGTQLGPDGFAFQSFQGVPLGTHDFGSGAVSVGATDTIVQHGTASGASPVATLELQKLQLQGIEQPDVFVTLQSDRNRNPLDPPNGPPSLGTMRFDFEPDCLGGIFDSVINVNFDVRFGSINGPIIGSDSLALSTVGTPWDREDDDKCMTHPEAASIASQSMLAKHGICGPAASLDGVNQNLNGVNESVDFFPGFRKPSVDLDVDTDRDGVVEDDEDDPDEEKWVKTRGAIYMVNYDDDDTRHGSGLSSDSLEIDPVTGAPLRVNETINNVADANDLSEVWIRINNAAPDDIKSVALKAKTLDDIKAVHIFPSITADARKIWGGPREANDRKDVTANVAIPGDTKFGLEGLFFRWNVTGAYRTFGANGFNGTVELKLEVTLKDGNILTDDVILKVAPFIMLPNTRPTVEAWEQIPGDLIPGSNGTLASSPWTQDHIEIGYTQAPGRPRTNMTFRLPYDRPMPDWPVAELLKPDSGLFLLRADFGFNSGDYGGNLELMPNTTAWPLGRIIVGNTMSPALYSFLKAQEVQDPFPKDTVDVNWLGVGHIDEILGFMPKGTGWAIVHANTTQAKSILNTLSGDAVFFASNTTSTGQQLNATGGEPKKLFDGIDFTQPEWAYARYIRIINGTGEGQVAEIDQKNNGNLTIRRVWMTPNRTVYGPTGPGPDKCVITCIGRNPRNEVVVKDSWFLDPAGPGAALGESKYVLVNDTKHWSGIVVDTAGGFVGRDFPAIISAGEVQNDTLLWNLNAEAQKRIQSSLNNITTALGQAPEFVSVPDIFMGVLNAGGIALRSSVAFMPSAANFQVANDKAYFPKGYGPNVTGVHVYDEAIKTQLPAASGFLALEFREDWNRFHRNKGGVHCGTNVKREPYSSAWWTA